MIETIGETPIKAVKLPSELPGPRKPVPKCNVVWRWPEFKAFAKRLGIDVTMPIAELTIRFPRFGPDGPSSVEITATTFGIDEILAATEVPADGKSA